MLCLPGLHDQLHNAKMVMTHVSIQGACICRTIAPDRSPFGSKDCIYVPRTMWEGGNIYYIVNSDTVSSCARWHLFIGCTIL